MRWAFCAVAAIALACLMIRAGRLGMAGDYIDPFSHIGAQDESLYAHSAIQMAEHGGWITPRFMGRYGLYKTPMLADLSGLSAKLLGVSRLALRLPVALMASLAVGLIFWWAAEINGWQAGFCAAALVMANHLWHSLASMCLTDGLLAAFYVAAIYCVFADPWLESPWALWGCAGAVAASILTKSVAGLLPLGVLGLYWIFAPRKYRPRFWRVFAVGGLSIALAAPWFVYQMTVHGRWFWAEHVQVEILGYGAGTPPQTTEENQALFYLTRMASLDPVLLALAAGSIPTFVRAIRRRSYGAILLLFALAIPAASVMIWQYRNISYVLPLVPAMAILATAYNPLCAGRTARWMMAAVVVAFVVKAALPTTTWGLPLGGGTHIAAAPLLSDYCARGRDNELIVVDVPDELYASLLPLPKVRYVLHGVPPAAGKYGLDFAAMGIILNERQFDDLPHYMPGFRARLHEWGLDSADAVGTVIFVESSAEVARIIASHPDADFLLSRSACGPAASGGCAAPATHEAIKVSPDYDLLLSKTPLGPSSRLWSCRL